MFFFMYEMQTLIKNNFGFFFVNFTISQTFDRCDICDCFIDETTDI